MKTTKSILLVALFLTYMSTSLAQINVMEDYNGDFEAGTFDYWRFVEVADSAAGSYAEIVDESYTGSHAAQLTWKSGASGIIDLVLDNWLTGPEVVAGHSYTLNAAIMAVEGTGLLHVSLGFFNSSGGVISESSKNWVLGDHYEVKEHVGTAPAGAINCWIAFRLFAENGSRWPEAKAITLIDDVQLWESPPDVTSINDVLPEDGLNLYPNPVANQLHVESKTEIRTISVYNMQGQLEKEIFKDFNDINMKDLSAGIYIIKVISDEETFFKTVVKE